MFVRQFMIMWQFVMCVVKRKIRLRIQVSVEVFFIESGIKLQKLDYQFMFCVVNVLQFLEVDIVNVVVLVKLLIGIQIELLDSCVGYVKYRNVWLVKVGFRKFLFVLLKIFLLMIILKMMFKVICYRGVVVGMISV